MNLLKILFAKSRRFFLMVTRIINKAIRKFKIAEIVILIISVLMPIVFFSNDLELILFFTVELLFFAAARGNLLPIKWARY